MDSREEYYAITIRSIKSCLFLFESHTNACSDIICNKGYELLRGYIQGYNFMRSSVNSRLQVLGGENTYLHGG